MIGTSILKLSSSNIQDSLSCALRNQMNETKKVLTGIAEAHSAPGSGLIVGSRAGHVEGNHALILIPDICHTVYMRILALYMIAGEQLIPVSIQLGKSCIHLLGSSEFLHNFFRRIFFDHIWGLPFVILWILAVAKKEHQFFFFPWCQCNIDLLAGNWVPSAGNGIAAFSFFNSNGIMISAAKT